MDDEQLYGRQLVWPKISKREDHWQVQSAIENGCCKRCGNRQLTPLPRRHWYCRACIALGRVSSLDDLISLPEPNDFSPAGRCDWNGQLTPAQQRVSQELISAWQANESRLVWAVTGAGKTEMLFGLLAAALQSGQRVAVVSPRIDVINELAPRLAQAFLDQTITVLHGHTGQPYEYSQFVLATTHQLLRFKQAFDLVVVDEVDSFPFRGDPMLKRALAQAVKVKHTTIYLTATPTPELLRRVKKGRLAVSYLPLRFHQHLLPNISIRRITDWRRRCPKSLKKELETLSRLHRPFLLFVPRIDDLPLVAAYADKYCNMQGHTVHAGDPDRQQKVADMRAGDVQYLITTTILERGVTFANLAVARARKQIRQMNNRGQLLRE